MNFSDRQNYHQSPLGAIGRAAERHMRSDRPEGFLRALEDCTAQDWKQIHHVSLTVQDTVKAEAWRTWVEALLTQRWGSLRAALHETGDEAMQHAWAQLTPAGMPWEAERLLEEAHLIGASDGVRAVLWEKVVPTDGVAFLMAHPTVAGPQENAHAWHMWSHATVEQQPVLASQMFNGFFRTDTGAWKATWATHADLAQAWGRVVMETLRHPQEETGHLITQVFREGHTEAMTWLDTQLGLSFEALVEAWVPLQGARIEAMGPLSTLPLAQRERLLAAAEAHGRLLPAVRAGVRQEQSGVGPATSRRRARS